MAFKTRQLLSKYLWLDAVRMKLLAWICTHGITFFDRSYPIVKIMSPGAASLLQPGAPRKPVLFALYHGRMVGALGFKPRHKLTILVSQSRDGEMIARAALGLGYAVARGSPSQGAVQGALRLTGAVKQEQDVVFMVDGPRGPCFQVKPGVIRLAQLMQIPIVPFVCSGRSKWWMRSWDKFLAPWWACPLVYIFGDPLTVPSNCSYGERQELLKELQSRMEHLRVMADNFWQA